MCHQDTLQSCHSNTCYLDTHYNLSPRYMLPKHQQIFIQCDTQTHITWTYQQAVTQTRVTSTCTTWLSPRQPEVCQKGMQHQAVTQTHHLNIPPNCHPPRHAPLSRHPNTSHQNTLPGCHQNMNYQDILQGCHPDTCNQNIPPGCHRLNMHHDTVTQMVSPSMCHQCALDTCHLDTHLSQMSPGHTVTQTVPPGLVTRPG